MRKLFFSLVAVVFAAVSYAQNTLVATLSHEESVTMYYGAYALRDAYKAAQSGDIISLSGGTFQAVNIKKAITLRGAGIDSVLPTFINGFFTIDIPSTDTYRLSMEGIRCTSRINMEGTFNSPYFVKCSFVEFDYMGEIKNAMYANCRISRRFSLGNSSTSLFINCYIANFQNKYQNSPATFVNSVLYCDDYSFGIDDDSSLLNCIIYQNNITENAPASLYANATNCVTIGYSNPFEYQVYNINNKTLNYNEFSKIFKTFTGTYSESEQFELTDDGKTEYLGNDGTEVGMHGGLLPYDTTPSYPQITKMNVAKKTTADGKLSVEIEVSAVE